jgi:cardiolipin synthase C
MHNKAFVADNQRAVLGGRNIGDEYFEANSDVAFGDLDVATLGPTVAEVSKAFDSYWNAPMSVPIGALTGRRSQAGSMDLLRQELAEFAEAEADTAYVRNALAASAAAEVAGTSGLFWGRAVLLVDDPEKVTRAPDDLQGHLLPQLSGLVGGVRDELLIVSPYFIPGDAGVAWLRKLAAQGVRVTVLTNSLASTDVGAVHAGYQKYREPLLEAGIRLYELKPGALAAVKAKGRHLGGSGSRGSLHAKTFVFDRHSVFIGSLNLDPRSTKLNTEIGVLCDSPAMADQLAGGIAEALDVLAWRVERGVGSTGGHPLVWTETTASGTIVEHHTEPEVGAMRRLGVWFLGLLPIESQL